MDNSTLLIILVVFVIIWSFLIVLLHKKTKNKNANNETLDLADDELVTLKSDKSVPLMPGEVDAIVLQNNSGEELSFSRIRTDLPGQYVELEKASYAKAGADILKTGLPVAEKAYTLAELSQRAPNGLFTATVSPDKLSKFKKDKTFTTIIRNDKNIEKHAGFKEIESLSNVNPLMATEMAMAAMAAVSGQYYLNKINDQLNQLNVSVDKLFSFHNDEKIAILQNAAQRFSELSNKQVVDDNDIAQLRRLGDDVSNVCYEYRPKVDDLWNKLEHFSTSKNKPTMSVEEYEQALYDWNYYRSICREASRLEQISKALEIVLRRRRDISDPQLAQLMADLKNSYGNSFYLEDANGYKGAMEKLTSNSMKLVMINKRFERDKKKVKNLFRLNNAIDAIQQLNESNGQLLFINELLEEKNEAQIVLFEDEEGKARTFLPILDYYEEEPLDVEGEE